MNSADKTAEKEKKVLLILLHNLVLEFDIC